MEKILLPKPLRPSAPENKTSEKGQGIKWLFAPGTNLLPGLGAKIERESKLKLNDFAKELRSFKIVDMSGMQPHLVILHFGGGERKQG